MDKQLKIIVEQINYMCEQLDLKRTTDFNNLIDKLENVKVDFSIEQLKNLYYDNEISIRQEYGLYNPQIVKIKSDRRCKKCKCVITNKSKALTTSIRDSSGKGTRYWYCIQCANEICNNDISDSDELIYNLEPDWDDGTSSNGN